MDSISKDLILILQYLLPGFLAAWVFYGFTSYPKPSQFERIVQALIFTLIVQTVGFVIEFIFLKIGKYWSIGHWNEQSDLICSAITALLIGIIFSYFANNDKFHRVIRNCGITSKTSYPSEWFGACQNNVTYVVLHFNDERRLYGWPIEWPSESDRGHFVLEQASWLDGTKEIPIKGVHSIIINVKDVKWVEFLEKTWEKKNDKEKL